MARILPVRGRASFARFRGAPTLRRGVLRVRYVAPDVAQPGVSEIHVAYQIGRHVGPAVLRNRIRRRLRAAVHELAGAMPPGQYLVVPTAQTAHVTYRDLVNTLSDCLSQIEHRR